MPEHPGFCINVLYEIVHISYMIFIFLDILIVMSIPNRIYGHYTFIYTHIIYIGVCVCVSIPNHNTIVISSLPEVIWLPWFLLVFVHPIERQTHTHATHEMCACYILCLRNHCYSGRNAPVATHAHCKNKKMWTPMHAFGSWSCTKNVHEWTWCNLTPKSMQVHQEALYISHTRMQCPSGGNMILVPRIDHWQ